MKKLIEEPVITPRPNEFSEPPLRLGVLDDASKCAVDQLPVTREAAVAPIDGKTRFSAEYLYVQAQASPELVDITHDVGQAVTDSGIAHGQVMIFCRHTTASVVINEDEPLLHEDIRDFLEALASSERDYRHDDFSIRTENIVPDHGRNAHAHLKTLVLGASVVLPILDGRLALGSWQRIFLVEMDRPKERTLLLQFTGVTA
jgi:secondary thiamine-phosphate synthase enzyme